ncbi:MAG TPA: phosphoribosylglycinamide formyltransferase [Chloroflexota bacterium]|nr:phosphoribosylglycinamide formyltransferase [Chloroflexota bacterium]
MTKLAVLASGRGSNLQAILEAGLPAALVVSNNPEAAALGIARQHRVETLIQPKPGAAGGRTQRDELLVRELEARQIEWLALAGYNQILSDCLLRAFANRIVNVHPSLLPAFAGGMAPEPQRQALEYGVKVSGCTVHLVTADVDAGPILAQACVPVLPDDTVDSLSQRILVEEHRLLPAVLRQLLAGSLALNGRRAAIVA